MRQLFTIDLKDYNPNGEKYYRPSVRGIIRDKQGKIAMIYSKKEHLYKLPGGGIEGSESHLEALEREIKEETGLQLIPSSVQEFGEALKIQNGNKPDKDVIHIQQNFYYTCQVENKIEDQNLDEAEQNLDFVFEFTDIDHAIKVNTAYHSDDPFLQQMVERERRVLEILKSEQ